MMLHGFTGRSQSIRLVASHCLSLPRWYRSSSRCRPSSYSQLKRVAPAAGTSQVPGSTGIVYASYVLTAGSLGGVSHIYYWLVQRRSSPESPPPLARGGRLTPPAP